MSQSESSMGAHGTRMQHPEYRRLIREHAKKRGFDRSRKRGEDWVWTAPNGARAVLPYEPPEWFGLATYAVYAKGLLTAANNKAVRAQQRRQKALDNPDVPTLQDDERWLYAYAPDYSDGHATEAGKWMMRFYGRYADDTWKNVAAAVRKGRLASCAKISTAASTPPGEPYVLCVYVLDYRDYSEAMAVRERLRELGFKRKIHFKRNAMTSAGLSGSEFSA